MAEHLPLSLCTRLSPRPEVNNTDDLKPFSLFNTRFRVVYLMQQHIAMSVFILTAYTDNR